MKGQVFTTDLLAATLIFLVMVGFISFLWIDITSAESRNSWRKITERETLKIMEAFVRTKGLPENWENFIASEYVSDSNTAGLWHLNDGSGSTASDSSGNNNDGDIYNDGSISEGDWVSCQFQTCLNFNTPVLNIPDKIEISASSGSSLDIHGSLTLEAWINPDSISGTQGIITRNLHSALWLDDGKIKFGVDGFSGFVSVESDSSVSAGRWTHIAGVYDAQNGKLRIYIGGDLDKEVDGSISTWYSNSNPFVIGNSRYSQLGSDHCCPFDGKIEEVRISNSVRSEFNAKSEYPLVIGLASGNHNILDSDKVDAFFGLDYSTVRDIFNVGNFQIKFIDSNRTMGSDPPAYASNVIFIRRFGLYKNSIEEIIMRVWTEN